MITFSLLVIALVFTFAAISYFIHVNSQTKRLTKTTKDEGQIPDQQEYSHMVVHDLRAPVVVIKDTASLLLSNKLNDGEQKNMLNLIHDQANKLLNQISTILDAAKAEEGKLSLKKSQGNIAQVVKEEIALFQPEAKRKNIRLVSEVNDNLPVFFFDNVRITEALNNILSNSLKYTNENGIVRISVDADDKYVSVSVNDNGIGIPAEKQNKLFTKFGQLNNNTKKENQNLSSGLGLYITKWIIEAHGGTIKINSEEGKGTIATFTLPIDKSNAKPMASNLN